MLACNNCKMKSIIQHIAVQVTDDIQQIPLDQFKEELLDIPLKKLHDCLNRHGYLGNIKLNSKNGFYYDHKEEK